MGTLTKKNKSAFSDICLRSFDFFNNYSSLLKVNLLCLSLTTILLTTIVLEMKSKMFLFGIFCKHCGRETKQNIQYIQNAKQYIDISKHKHFNRNLFVLIIPTKMLQ